MLLYTYDFFGIFLIYMNLLWVRCIAGPVGANKGPGVKSAGAKS